MSSETEAWERDKARFVADLVSRDHGAPLGPLAQQFATLTYSLLDASTTAEVLDQIVHAAVHLVPGADIVSITLRSPDGRFHTPVRTDKSADEFDQLQYEYGEGPCVDAAREDGPASAVSDDLATSTTWPRFGPAAAERGAGALLSTALVPDARPPRLSGAINIYSRRPHGLDTTDQTAALLLATHASLALANVESVTRAQLEAEQLKRAVDSRDVIGQAKGILMARRGIPAGEAFDLLRRTSQDLNVKLVRLAETLAENHTDLLGGN
ncbi:GAF and ANTAR domain-containing protein [Amycolatopsis alba]|uniref:ANTAR domain-containing protein n=1 Tax=Amycolatopsis alba DSM 44262 TaxID=1125972 RepID=A0A229S7P4_AMYAL|nr:GAF and ANTAR domain-containing protein [Amycolatopsis alba]OXM54972.1 hypothetical protein CFP75_02210 [Amycolatopsis alba DSM 44262]